MNSFGDHPLNAASPAGRQHLRSGAPKSKGPLRDKEEVEGKRARGSGGPEGPVTGPRDGSMIDHSLRHFPSSCAGRSRNSPQKTPGSPSLSTRLSPQALAGGLTPGAVNAVATIWR